MSGNIGSGVWADAPYRSEDMEAKLRARKLTSHIHRMGTRRSNGRRNRGLQINRCT
jgi:IS5 family transposase